MQTLYEKIDQALVMGGLTPAQVVQAKAGAPIYGDAGMVDSLGLVRLISAVSTGFEDMGIDMFDMMADLDVEAMDAFASRETIHGFLNRVLERGMAEAV